MSRRAGMPAAFLLVLLLGCAHSAPQIVQIHTQLTRTWDPQVSAWQPRLSVFVQAAGADGVGQYDRLHLIQDQQSLWVPLTPENWSVVERPGEYWLGANGLVFPPGTEPTGSWRVELVTKTGLKAEALAIVPPVPADAPGPRTEPVSLRSAGPLQYQVIGWPEDYLVWSRDAAGALIGRTKTVGLSFTVPAGAATFELYTYDRKRGEGLAAGPFSVKDVAGSADR